MATIKERAKEKLEKYSEACYLRLSEDTEEAYKEGFHDGATDQRKIDIEKACEAYCKTCDTKECEDFGCEYCCDWVEKFRKAMEK